MFLGFQDSKQSRFKTNKNFNLEFKKSRCSEGKDGGRTGIFDRPAFVLQPTLGNIEVIEERSEFINT